MVKPQQACALCGSPFRTNASCDRTRTVTTMMQRDRGFGLLITVGEMANIQAAARRMRTAATIDSRRVVYHPCV